MPVSAMTKKTMLAVLVFFGTFTLSACGGKHTTELVFNPYDGIDWKTVGVYLTNLHTHTTASPCGQAPPHDVVDFYQAWGYDILAMTDHDEITYPWSFSQLNPAWEDRDPDAVGMLAVKGNEFTNSSSYHDMIGLFTNYLDSADDASLDETLAHVAAEADAVFFFAHPGRYWKIYEDYGDEDVFSPAWYMSYFNLYPPEKLIGLEVFNRNNRHPNDTVLWDTLLEQAMPGRPIFGLGNDDYHGTSAERNINYSFTYQLIAGTLTVAALRASLINGTYVTSHTTQETHTAPIVEAIIVNTKRAYIEIVASDYEVINWISGTQTIDVDGYQFSESRIVATGKRFYYGDFDGNYVRAEIVKVPWPSVNMSVTLTQPFGFARIEEDE